MSPSPEAYAPRTFRFACQIVLVYRDLNRLPGFPAPLARQLLRAGTSIGANLEESRPAPTRKDLRFKFTIALKEARETKYWLRLFVATGLAPQALLASLIDEVDQLVAILTVSVRKLKTERSG